MKKVSYALAALALLAAIVFKITIDTRKPDYTPATPRPAASAVSPADAAANGICRGTLTVAMFSPEMGIVQDDVDSYAQRYKDDSKTCDAIKYLGNVVNADGSTDEIFTMTIAGKNLWYIFTIADGLVINIQ